MVLDTLATATDGIGMVVGLTALSIAVWVVVAHRSRFDAPYVAALYMVGMILVFLAFEVDIAHTWPTVFGRFVIYSSVAVWEVVIVSELASERTDIPLREMSRSDLADAFSEPADSDEESGDDR